MDQIRRTILATGAAATAMAAAPGVFAARLRKHPPGPSSTRVRSATHFEDQGGTGSRCCAFQAGG